MMKMTVLIEYRTSEGDFHSHASHYDNVAFYSVKDDILYITQKNPIRWHAERNWIRYRAEQDED